MEDNVSRKIYTYGIYKDLSFDAISRKIQKIFTVVNNRRLNLKTHKKT